MSIRSTHFRAPTLLALGFLLPFPAAAQSADLIADMLAPVDEVMGGQSLSRFLSRPLAGGLDAGSRERVTVSLPTGMPFRIVGVCDADCSDLDLTLLDPSGAELETDIALDATPILDGEVASTGSYTLRVDMVSCSVEPCYWTAMVYVATGQQAVAAGSARTGELGAGDPQLEEGEYYDEFTVEASAGSRLVVDLESSAFDTYLIVQAPSGEDFQNDDHEGSTDRSHLEVNVTEGGAWRVLVTSFGPGETGAYSVRTTLDGAPVTASTATGPSSPGTGSRRESGRLATGDRALDSGELYDEYTVSATGGSSLVVDLTSADFDTYLFVVAPDGTQQDNDDFEGDVSRSVVAMDLEQDGEYRVVVTSYAAGEEGAYDLVIQTDAATAPGGGVRSERGALAAGDETLNSGEYLDEYTFEGRPGQRVRVDVESSDFDTYVMLIGPDEFREENDDFEGSTGHSAIEADLTERGTYRVIVTSYAPGEEGAYTLALNTSSATASIGQRDVERLEPGVRARGSLQEGDATIETGEYRDLWAFEGAAGEHVVIEMTSSGFDSWLGLIGPDGTVIDQNDDADGRTDLSRVEVTLGDSGRYRVVATSYTAGETGSYTLELDARTATAGAGPVGGGGRAAGAQVYGIFAGISDYGGRASNLAYTADDAVNFADALIEGAGMQRDNAVVLTDAQATVGNIEAAFEEIGRRMGPEDTFVFFYSGHGSRVPRPDGPDRLDPDGLDETLALYDADLTDDRMHELMTLVDGGTSVLILDACFSGGFSKDVISMPGRIGFFSSEEDVTSQVAAKFRAGGYLSIFAADAVGGGYADMDGDGAINAIELSQYLHERYRADVKSADPSEYVRTGGPQSGFQHLVVDRGSIQPYDVVFPRR